MSEGGESGIVLGAEIGPPSAATGQMETKTKVVEQMLRRIQAVQDPQVEYAIARACLGVSKVKHSRASAPSFSCHSRAKVAGPCQECGVGGPDASGYDHTDPSRRNH